MPPPSERRGPQDFLAPYIHQLGLQWQVHASVSPEVDRPSITSNRAGQEHRIQFPPGHMREEFRCDFVHELVHGKLAETIDPIFSGVLFHPSYSVEDPVFQRQARMVYYAQMPVEVWVADYMATVDPALVQEDVGSWYASMLLLPPEAIRRYGAETVIPWGINHADVERNNMVGFGQQGKRTLQKIETVLGKDAAKTAKKLGEYFQRLPLLPQNPQAAIPLFEQATQRTAQMLRLPIRPRLVRHEQDWVWMIDAA